MNDWAPWISWACVAFYAAGLAYVLWTAFRVRRAYREAAARRDWLVAEIERIAVLDYLLMHLCCEACGRDTGPIWQAWAQTLGTIEMHLKGSFRGRQSAAQLLPGGTQNSAGLVGEEANDDAKFD